MLTAALWGLILLFTAGDAVAHFTHYRYGPTVSWTIWWAEKRFPWLHIVIALAAAVLVTHLEWQVP